MIKTFDATQFVRVIGDGAFSDEKIQSGRLIPVLILDCSNRRDIADLIRLHKQTGPGDVVSTWAHERWPGKIIALHLKFLRPIPCEAMIRFDLPKQLSLIDSIIHNHACYLQASDFGPKLSEAFYNVPRILAEIPSGGLPFDWEKEYDNYLIQRFRSDGLDRHAAKAAARAAKATTREFFKFREGGMFGRMSPEHRNVSQK